MVALLQSPQNQVRRAVVSDKIRGKIMKKKEDIKQIVLELAQAAFDKKGRDIEILDLDGISILGDYFLIVSANNSKQSQSITDEMEDKAAELGITVQHREGYREGEWILLDFGDIICHVFGGDELREFYGLEELWNDAGRVPFEGV
jgi:iojap-like protein